MTDSPTISEPMPPPAGRTENLLAVCWRQWRTERNLRRRGIDFRTTDPDAAREAYAAMTAAEFTAINGRQAWANRRTIARSLHNLLPEGPIAAIDLGCGVGESTRVLASLLPAGSTVLGIEFAIPLVEIARARPFHAADGSPAAVEFVAGSVADLFHNAQGTIVPADSIDLVNASGIFGHHLSPADVRRSLAEIRRVLCDGGIAALDPGPKLPAKTLRNLLNEAGFAFERIARSNAFDRTGQIVARLPAM